MIKNSFHHRLVNSTLRKSLSIPCHPGTGLKSRGNARDSVWKSHRGVLTPSYQNAGHARWNAAASQKWVNARSWGDERERDARINICRINISGGSAPFERPLYCSIMADNRAHYDFFNRVHDQVSAFLFVPWGGGGWGERRLEKLLDGSIVGFKNGRILMGSWLVES